MLASLSKNYHKMGDIMNQQQIKTLIPHRDSMLLIDAVTVDEEGRAHGVKTIVGNEWFLDGHFPGNPVVPGVILCEILAQSICAAFQKEDTEGKTPYFSSLKEVKFKNPVKPGDVLKTVCEVIKVKAPFVFAKGKGYVENKLCVSAEFSFAFVANTPQE